MDMPDVGEDLLFDPRFTILSHDNDVDDDIFIIWW